MSSHNRRLTHSYAIADLFLLSSTSSFPQFPVSFPQRGPSSAPPPATPPPATPPATTFPATPSPATPSPATPPPTMPPPTASGATSSNALTMDKHLLFVGGDSSADEDQPPTKKPKANDKNKGASGGKRGNKKVIPRWSPLPVRINRVINPGAPDRKNMRCTSAQVTADKKQKEGLIHALDALAERRIAILAEMEVGQQAIDEAEDRDAIRTLADVEAIDGIKDIEMAELASDVDNSEYNGDTDVDGGDPDSEKDLPAPKGVRVASAVRKAKKKPGKGVTRAAVEAAKEAIVKRKKKEFEKASALKKGKLPTPSGTLPGWKPKGGCRPSCKTMLVRPSEEVTLMGGLDDEDASAVQPTTFTKSRINDLIVIGDDGDVSECDNGKMAITSRIKPTAIYRAKAASVPRATSGFTPSPQTPNLKAKSKSSKLKCEASFSSISTNSSVREIPISEINGPYNGLPEFAKVKWSSSFLPTLYACLGSASNPWKLYEDGSSMVDTIQCILNAVYPNSGYRVKLGDKIFSMAKDRLNEKRTYFGREGIRIVSDFLKSDRFGGGRYHRDIVRYAIWATQCDGPGVWGVPTPMNSTIPSEHPNYVGPKDLFESHFVIELVSPFLKWCEGSCHDFGQLKGAFALAAAGIECGFRMYHSGSRNDVGQFLREIVGDIVDDYVANAKIMSPRRWAQLLRRCGVQDPTKAFRPAVQVPGSSMQQKCRKLYVCSSPVESDEE